MIITTQIWKAVVGVHKHTSHCCSKPLGIMVSRFSTRPRHVALNTWPRPGTSGPMPSTVALRAGVCRSPNRMGLMDSVCTPLRWVSNSSAFSISNRYKSSSMATRCIPISALHRPRRLTNLLRTLPPLRDAATRMFLPLKKGSSITDGGSLETGCLDGLGLKVTSWLDVPTFRTACMGK